MINYADYIFYSKEYKGSLSEDLFNSLIVRASREIDKNINCDLTQEAINKLTKMEQYKLKYTACELCNFINLTGGNSSNGEASSISIDGVVIKRNETSESQIIRNKREIIANLPTNLTRFL